MMKKEIPWRKSIFTKLLIAFFLVILPIYVIGFGIYTWAINAVRNEIAYSMENQVFFYLDGLKTEIQSIQMLQYDCFTDESLNKLEMAASVMSNYERDQSILRVQQRLNAIRNSNRYIDSVKIYIPSVNTAITNNDTMSITAEDENTIRSYSGKLNTYLANRDGNLCMNALYPYSNSYDGKKLPTFLFQIVLSNERLKKVLGTYNINEKSGTFIFNQQINYLNIGESDMQTALWIRDHLKMPSEKGNLATQTIEWNGEEYFTIYSTSEFLNLTLVRYIPENVVFKKANEYKIWFWIISALTILIATMFSIYANRFINKPLHKLVKAFSRVENAEFDVDIKHNREDEFGYIYKRFNNMVSKLNTLIDQVYKQKILVQHAELKQLQSQINPHFLYNSFFILSRRIKYGDTDNSIQFCNQLGSYFQFITRSAANEVPLSKEVEHARIYTDIQAVRFQNRITVLFEELPQSLANIIVPRLILQPVIENVFEHGLEDKERDGSLEVRFFQDNGFMQIVVEDNGDKLTDEILQSLQEKLEDTNNDMEKTAMINIHKRIRLKFGRDSGLFVSRGMPGGLKVTLVIRNDGGMTDV